ncbi:hypothetical protein [Rhodopirellula sp. P2]|uniref:hypothetical protein n=1 Tax=Rhodopirellula sp. P2 TaxID=2127060 RepID=UPI00236752FE|nr:hypothetical protein [Rhodopirellula sp. P2]WDQ17115.1 hypothetical protein PSR62_00850 [Rhodopirellula sp. P2]
MYPGSAWAHIVLEAPASRSSENDGEQAQWIDGKLRGHWTGFNWRASPIRFANALTLESDVTDRWAKQSGNIVYFDNVVLSKSCIGPSGTAR